MTYHTVFLKFICLVYVISSFQTKYSFGQRSKRNLKNEIFGQNYNDSTVDHSNIVFASYNESRDSWVIVKDVDDWLYNDTIGAQAKFENKQQETGWMFLNLERKEKFSDE